MTSIRSFLVHPGRGLRSKYGDDRVPGIKIVASSNPSDAHGLMRSAIENYDPVASSLICFAHAIFMRTRCAALPLAEARVAQDDWTEHPQPALLSANLRRSSIFACTCHDETGDNRKIFKPLQFDPSRQRL